MSDYPRGEWKPSQSFALQSRMSSFPKAPFLVRRAREAFLYDIDNYKYVDFELQRGEVLLGYKSKHFYSLENQIERYFFGASLSLVHYKLERKAKLWLEKQGIQFQSLRFFHTVGEAFLFLQEQMGFSSGWTNVWSVQLPPLKKGNEVCLFETMNESLEEYQGYSRGTPILVENACLVRVNDGISLREGWEVALIGSVLGNGCGGAMVISRRHGFVEVAPIRVVIAAAMEYTLSALLEREQIAWPVFPSSFRQRGGLFCLPDDVSPELLLPHGVYVRKTGFLSFAHTEHEVRRLVKAVHGQMDPSV